MALTSLPFATQSYPLENPSVSKETLINLYLEPQPETARSKFVVRNTPGLFPFASMNDNNPVCAMGVQATEVFAISGNALYRISGDGTSLLVGVWPGGGDPYRSSIACSDTQVVVCTPPNIYYLNAATLVFNPIIPEEPFAAASVTYLDGRFIFSEVGTGRFHWSELNDASDVRAMSFATQERAPDYLLGVHAFGGDLWLFGQRTIEIWASVGSADAPFQRQSGAVIEIGTLANRTVAAADNSLCWVGDDLIVYRSNGSQPARISTAAIEQELNDYNGKDSTIGYALSHAGHVQYAITFPQAGRTWVYDFWTKLWHLRATHANDQAWRGQSSVRFGDFQLVGDALSGRIWRVDHRIYAEAGLVMPRTAILPPIEAETRRAFMASLELEMEVGVKDPIAVTMSYSDNGGRDWSPPQIRSTGGVNAFNTRLRWHRLGSFRQRMIRFEITGNGPVALLGAYADITAGEH